MTRLSNFLVKCKKNEQAKKVKTFNAEGSSTAELHNILFFFRKHLKYLKTKQKKSLKIEPKVSMRSQLMGVREYSANLGDGNVFC